MKINNTTVEVTHRDISQLSDDVAEKVVSLQAQDVDQHQLRKIIAEELAQANQLNLISIAFPALGCEPGNFPIVGAAKIMAQEILKVVKAGTSLQTIMICVIDEKICNQYKQTAVGYLDHVLNTLGEEPYKTVDAIIELPEGIILIERSNPPYGWALPGGFVDEGEDLESAAIREAKEETNMDLEDVRELGVYSGKDRDPRFHTISTVYIARGVGTPQFGDDAKGLQIIAYEDLLKREYAFDHHKVIEDYLAQRKG